MPVPRDRYAPKPWLAAMGGLLAVLAALLLPGVHANVGWEHDEPGTNESCADKCECGDVARSSEPSRDHSPHHDDSTCDTCRQILILHVGVSSMPDMCVPALDASAIDACGIEPQVAQALPTLDVRRSRGPPTA